MLRAVALLVLAVAPFASAWHNGHGNGPYSYNDNSNGNDLGRSTGQLVIGDASNGGLSANAGNGVAAELPENVVYKGVDYSQYSTGYGAPPNSGGVERIDEPLQTMPDIVEQAQGQGSVAETHYPDTNLNNRYDTTKEIHSSTLQRRITNQFNRNLRRYFKQLNVNALYNTNVQRVLHNKLVNVLNVQSQDTHRPVLRVQFNRQDTVTNLGDRSEAPIVENQASANVLPPVVEQVQVERLGYDGQPQAPGVGLRCYNCGNTRQGYNNNGNGDASDNRYTSEYPSK